MLPLTGPYTRPWAAGVANANDVAERTKEDIRADAVERAFMWTDRLTDGLDGLSAKETAVMQYVITETERRAMPRVTCPGRVVAEHAKLHPPNGCPDIVNPDQ